MNENTCFQNEEEFQRIYGECLEHEVCASRAVNDSYKSMCEAFERYLSATREDMFRFAYQCGYEAGRKAAER